MADPPIQEAPGNGGASEIARLVRRRVSTRSDECCEQRVGGDGVMCASQRCGDAPDFLEQVPPLVSFTPVTGHGAWSRCQGLPVRLLARWLSRRRRSLRRTLTRRRVFGFVKKRDRWHDDEILVGRAAWEGRVTWRVRLPTFWRWLWRSRRCVVVRRELWVCCNGCALSR